jgi:hypothetical protein
VEDEKKVGVGAVGAGECPAGYTIALASEVYRLLDLGTPKLAYARAMGFTLEPFHILVSAPFTTTQTTTVPNAGNASKIFQDTLVTEIDYTITNTATPAGLDSLTNFFFSEMSGITAQIKIEQGAGSYNPVPDFEPLRLLRKKLFRPWLLGINTGVKMNFRASVVLPFPVQVDVTFFGETTWWPKLMDMTTLDCMKRLQSMGFMVSKSVPAIQ